MTAWLALNSGATPDCSCLYCLPAGVDEGYLNGDDESTSPLDAIFGGRKEVFQDIRCLPCESGSGILFSHRLLHWGSRGCALHEQRISVSFAFADAEWEAPYLKDEHRSFPPLELRLGLTCGQLISYYQVGPNGRLSRDISSRVFVPTFVNGTDSVASSFLPRLCVGGSTMRPLAI